MDIIMRAATATKSGLIPSTVGYHTAQLFKISHQFAGRLLRTGVLITRLQMDNCRV